MPKVGSIPKTTGGKPLSKTPKSAGKAPTNRFTFYRSLQNDQELCNAIQTCFTAEDHVKPAQLILKHEWIGWISWHPDPTALFRDVISWAQKPDVWDTLEPNFQGAIRLRKLHLHDVRSRKRAMISAGLKKLNEETIDSECPSKKQHSDTEIIGSTSSQTPQSG